MKKFTDPKKTDIWKKTYGFDYVHVEPKGEFRYCSFVHGLNFKLLVNIPIIQYTVYYVFIPTV